jgi:protein gp37
MSDSTNIEWADATFNGWEGCTKVGPGCDHCYAEASRDKRLHRVEWGAGKPRRRTSAANWKNPERWNLREFFQCGDCGARNEGVPWEDFDQVSLGKLDDGHACAKCKSRNVEPVRRRVFCASLADWLDNEAPIEWLVDLLDLIRRTPNLDWLLLTKRIGNWRPRLLAVVDHLQARITRRRADEIAPAWEVDTLVFVSRWVFGDAPTHIWIGATIVNQVEADRDIPKLLQVPARVRFLSIEPMLEAVTIFDMDGPIDVPDGDSSPLHWVIAGGESGANARPSHPDWFRELRDQCEAAGVPFLFKQYGEWAPGECGPTPTRTLDCATLINDSEWDIGRITVADSLDMHRDDEPDVYRMGKKAAGRKLDGVEHNGFPVAGQG